MSLLLQEGENGWMKEVEKEKKEVREAKEELKGMVSRQRTGQREEGEE